MLADLFYLALLLVVPLSVIATIRGIKGLIRAALSRQTGE